MNDQEKIALIALAESAGAQIMKYYRANDQEVTFKSDDSPLTNADKAADMVIKKGLNDLYPHIPVISEEMSIKDLQGDHRTFWLVDPLDGTREFINKNDEFTVNIALIQDKLPIFGVVHAPALKSTYYGQRCEGAWRTQVNADKKATVDRIYVSPAPTKHLRILVSRSHADTHTTEFLTKIPDHELVSAGSSLKFCKLADGSADIYPRLGNTMEWDTAAGQCILEAAGGCVVSFDGNPLTYRKPEWRNPHFLAIGGKLNDSHKPLINDNLYS